MDSGMHVFVALCLLQVFSSADCLSMESIYNRLPMRSYNYATRKLPFPKMKLPDSDQVRDFGPQTFVPYGHQNEADSRPPVEDTREGQQNESPQPHIPQTAERPQLETGEMPQMAGPPQQPSLFHQARLQSCQFFPGGRPFYPMSGFHDSGGAWSYNLQNFLSVFPFLFPSSQPVFPQCPPTARVYLGFSPYCGYRPLMKGT